MSNQNQLKVFHDEFKNSRLPENVEEGAQANVIESISLNGVKQPVADKNVDLTAALSDFAKKTDLNILSTTPSTVDGQIWFEFQNHYPVLKIFYGGEEFTFIGAGNQPTTQTGGASTYYFGLSGANLIENYSPDELVVLEDGLELTNGVFTERGDYKDLVLSFGNDTTATIRTTIASALESLDTAGRTILFVDSNERRNRITFYDGGRIITGNAITLASDYTDSTFAAGTFTSVTAARSPISIQGGTLPSVLKSSSGNDTLVGNSGNDTFTGGTGDDLFVVKLTGDNVINDFDATTDQISLVGGDMSQLQGLNLSSGGLELEFDGGTLMLAGFSSGTLTVDGTTQIIEGTSIFNGTRTAVTFFAPADANLSDTIYAGISTLNAQGGGTIQAGSTGVVMSGNSAVLNSGNGADTFLYTGGDITIGNYASGDCISLDQGYTLEDYELNVRTGQSRLTICDTLGNEGYVILSGVNGNTDIDIYDANGSKNTYNLAPVENFILNNDDESSALAATVEGTYADFSKQNPNRTEVYTKLTNITLTQPNSMIIGNSNNNLIVVEGGSDNILTGGLGKDTYSFTEGGGIITDFGIGATKNGDGTELATSPKHAGYDPTDPTTYAHNLDTLKVKGTVNGIYFERDGNTSNAPTFTAVISYNDGIDEQIIVLKDVVKEATMTGATPIYQANDEAAATFTIYDTSGNRQAILSAAKLRALFRDDSELTVGQRAQVNQLLSRNFF